MCVALQNYATQMQTQRLRVKKKRKDMVGRAKRDFWAKLKDKSPET